jgi:hypothetical protein
MNTVRRGLAALAVGGTTLAGVAVAGTTVVSAATRVPTSLTISAPHEVSYNRAASVTGVLTNTRTHKALGGLKVVLRERRPGTLKWAVVATSTTSSAGKAAFSVVLTRAEQVQLTHPATASTQATTSSVRTINVAYAVAATLTGTTVHASVAPNAAKQQVQLQKLTNHQWVTVQTTKLAAASTATFTIKAPKQKGTYSYRVEKSAAHGYLQGVSHTLTLIVP